MSVKPPVEMLRDISYDPETGVFTRLKSAGNARCGDRADRINTQGRMRIWWGNSIYSAHRVAWFICHGEWPDMWIDHINGDPTDNRIANLRLCTPTQNNANMRGKGKLPKGVTFHRQLGKFQAQIKSAGRSHYLGVFDNANDAHAAYVAKATELFGEFARAS